MPKQIISHAQDDFAVNDRENFSRILTDAARVRQYLIDLQSLIIAAQRVTWLRFGVGPEHDDPHNILGKNHPRLSDAIFRLGNLVGVINPDAE